VAWFRVRQHDAAVSQKIDLAHIAAATISD
jgi:hypothetical protein